MVPGHNNLMNISRVRIFSTEHWGVRSGEDKGYGYENKLKARFRCNGDCTDHDLNNSETRILSPKTKPKLRILNTYASKQRRQSLKHNTLNHRQHSSTNRVHNSCSD